MKFAEPGNADFSSMQEDRKMYADTIDGFAKLAEKKLAALRRSPGGFFVASMLAGAYVGMGILLIFTLGNQVPVEFQKLIMGASFGIALTLVVIAGAELFTGHTMFMALRGFGGTGSVGDVAASWTMTWVGNLVGSLLLVWLFALGGGGGLLSAPDTLVMKVAAAKMNGSAVALFARAILCNWLVCLALWMSARVNSDAAKCIVIFWCLFAFIANGFEHSVANMTLLGLAMAGNHPETVSIAGFGWNLFWVTLGNIVGGGLFVAGAYHVSTYGFPISTQGEPAIQAKPD
jgi:nitrite transporter NirC